VLAGPTCDGDDVLYRHADVRLPLDLTAGDTVEFLGAGAYTSSYASVGFNGLPPLPTVIRDRAPDETPEETD
jgi:ornithine decarboxylase